ncbi:Nucleotide-diphospho-sugar transferase family protein [Prunus dulcis]|uniref:Nucleotide-diphospho-sugar transferase family protein n=1 Tax=Prunus dulcis TaxID=3755 RepID=A0A4Y1QZG0_PRUDU|nr:Nucleotide-diphospho-sugar transferase family protein [Prunus dulcis]
MPSTTTTTTFNVAPDELLATLDKTSIGNKTVIIAVVNKAYAVQEVKADTTMLDLFIESFWQGEDTRHLLDHLVLVAVDQMAYDRCQFLRLNCYRLETDGVDFGGEKLYMSQDFIKMMWRRTWFLLEVLKRGYNFIFTDTDVLWLRNPFSRLSKNETEDLQISIDKFFGDPWNEKQPINTGFYHIRSNNKTIALFDRWYTMKENATGQKEQDVLVDLIRGGSLGGWDLGGFCQDSKDFGAVTTVHANCCRSIGSKVKDLKAVLQDWKQFKKTTTQKTTAGLAADGFKWSGHWGAGIHGNPNNNGKATPKA